MEARTAAIALLRQQERSLSLLKQQQEQQQEEQQQVELLRQEDDQHLLSSTCHQDETAELNTKGNGSDLLFMELYMSATRSIGTL